VYLLNKFTKETFAPSTLKGSQREDYFSYCTITSRSCIESVIAIANSSKAEFKDIR